MSGQVSRRLYGDYQSDERAGVNKKDEKLRLELNILLKVTVTAKSTRLLTISKSKARET